MATETTQPPDPRSLSRDELRDYLHHVPTVSIEFAGACLDVSRPAAYRAAAAGEIVALSIGRRRVVPSVWLERTLMLDDDRRAAANNRTEGHESCPSCAGTLRGCTRDAHDNLPEGAE